VEIGLPVSGPAASHLASGATEAPVWSRTKITNLSFGPLCAQDSIESGGRVSAGPSVLKADNGLAPAQPVPSPEETPRISRGRGVRLDVSVLPLHHHENRERDSNPNLSLDWR